MTALSKLQLKQLWKAYFQPTSADFSNLIDSWADYNYTATGTSAVARPVISKLGDIVSVKDFGAVGDGVTDDRAAIAAAVVAARGKTLYFPKGKYLINTDGGSITVEEVTVLGDRTLDGDNYAVTTGFDQGSIFYITGTTNPAFKVRRGTQFDGVQFYYPNISPTSPTPTAHPPTLDVDFTTGPQQFIYVKNCVAFNSYRFMRIDEPGGGVGHIWIENNTICGLYRAIEITKNLEVIKILGNTFSFGHWVDATVAGAQAFYRANAICVEYKQGDGIWFCNNLVFGNLRGIAITTGQVALCTIANNSFDQVLNPIITFDPGHIAQSNVNNNLFLCFNSQNTSIIGFGIYLAKTSGVESLNIVGNTFGQTTGSHIVCAGNAGGIVNITGNTFEGMAYQQASGNWSALGSTSTQKNINFSGNMVVCPNTDYANGIICTAVNTLQANGNWFSQAYRPISISSAGQVTLTGNVSYATRDTIADNISGVTNEIWQTGNCWDKTGQASTKPAFLVRKNASQTFNSVTATDATWETEVIDKGGDFASNVFTAPKTGRYRFSWSLLHDNTGTAGDRWQCLMVAGSVTFAQSYLMVGNYNSVQGNWMTQLTSGQTVKVQIQRVGGSGNFVTLNDPNSNWFCGEWIE